MFVMLLTLLNVLYQIELVYLVYYQGMTSSWLNVVIEENILWLADYSLYGAGVLGQLLPAEFSMLRTLAKLGPSEGCEGRICSMPPSLAGGWPSSPLHVCFLFRFPSSLRTPVMLD